MCMSVFPDVLYRIGSLCLLLLEAFPHPCEALHLGSINLLPSPAPSFLNAKMLKLVCTKVMISYLKNIKRAPEWNVISSS